MADKKMQVGPTGDTVRQNVKRLRGGMQYKELSQRMEDVGRPIPTLGLRRLEAGERRVDVDDLMALAVVFGVSPLTILLPADGTRFAASEMTGVTGRQVSHNTQWLWALGEEPLELPDLGQTTQARREVAVFQDRAKPDVDPRSLVLDYWEGNDPEAQEVEALKQIEELGVSQGLAPPDGDD